MAQTDDLLGRRRSELASRRAALSAVKQQELDRILNRPGVDESATRVVAKRQSREFAPLSFAQERLWFLHQFEPESVAYNVCIPLRVTGRLNLAALSQSIYETVRRHESLRTTFVEFEGKPVQVVAPARNRDLPINDLSSLPETERALVAERLVHEAHRRHFDLAKGPLFQPAVIRLASEEHVLLVVLHHIIFDDWSMQVLVRDVGETYRAYEEGLASPLGELQIQYADYAEWYREELRDEVLAQELSYWRTQLADSPPVLNLPLDHPRPPVMTYAGDALQFTVPEELTDKLRNLTRATGSSFFMTLLASFQMLLSRYTGQDDVVIATPIAGRATIETEELIGFFLNTLLIRTRLNGDPSLRTILDRVREVVLEAQSHQDLPFEKLVEELHPERNLSHGPLFEVMFVFNNKPRTSMQVQDVTMSLIESNSGTEKFGLTLEIDEARGLNCSLSYRTDLFEKSTVERFAKHWRRLLEALAEDSNQLLSEVTLLDADEQAQVITRWNDNAVPLPEACIHQLFAQQVKERPDAIAVEFEGEQLTYRELDGRANDLAQRLRREGVGPEVFVGVMLERSAKLIVSLLGIAKAGGVYMPINLSDPPKRIAFILEDAGVKTVVTTRSIAETLAGLNATLVYVDEPIEKAEENLSSDLTPDNLAYLMYTSGSTGTPKGVCITHRNVLRLVKGANYAALNPEETFLHFAPVSFDASTFEIWGALLNGARLVVFPPHLPSLEELAEFVNRTQVTTMWLTGGLFHQLVDSDAAPMTTLKQLLAGGEALSPIHVSKALKELNGCHLINGYGPTETTTFACCYQISPDYPGPSVPIGRPISNTTAYVLNAMQPAAVGERGELFIGGLGLGRGYHKRPDLTAERFLPDPYAVEPGNRLYRTGDAVRYLDQGVIRFLGRVDDQLKISGFRIEPAEIESVLAKHPAVSESVVLARESANGDRRLIAYFVTNGGPAASSDELKKYLQERLPNYMVPNIWIRLDQIPLTANGKVDRAALPAPDMTRLESIPAFEAPRTQTEEILAGIWQQVLDVERIGRADNFFALGGYSLLATRIVSRIREGFQIELPVRYIFEWPTVAELAERIEETLRAGATPTLPPLERLTGTAPLPLSYAQQRLWFLDQLTPHNTAYNIPVGFRIRGPLNLRSFEQSLNETVRRHEALRTNFVNVDGQPVQVVEPELKQSLPVIDLEQIPAAKREVVVQRLAHEAAQQPFDLANEPLLRTTVFRLNEQEHVLLVVTHHIVSDGWSMDVLTRDVPRTYKAFSAGAPAELPELPIQYADFASWQRQWLTGETLEQELAYWRHQLDGSLPQLNLPTDRPRPSALSLKGSEIAIALPDSLTTKLRELSQAEGSTLFITLLASFQILLARYSGQDDIAVGTPIAGRRWAETEDLIGFFVNTLVMRTRLAGEPTVRDVLRRVREVTLEAQTHQDVPFEKLVEELQPQRTLSHGPLFQTMFVYLNEARRLETLDDLSFSSLELDHGTEKNDLTLRIVEQENRLVGSLSYSTDLFDESTIRRMSAHWQRLLEAIVANPEQLLRDIDLISADERVQMLEEWNATEREFPEHVCLHELFEKQAGATPEAVAVSIGDERLSYAELNARANQLAHYLCKIGVEPETPVALYLERSVDMIVAVLGVLKAGGAYLPLETTHPKGRVQYVLDDARARVILAQQRTAATLPEHRAQVICLDSDWANIAAEPWETPPSNITAENLAYVIYTSGSTGGARGVMVQHRSVVNLAAALSEKLSPEEKATLRVSVNAPLMFDSSVKQLVQLLYGHELCLIPEEVRIDGDALAAYIRSHEIDVLDCTPSQLRLLLDAGLFNGDAQAPRMVLIGGEAIDVETWQALASASQTTFFNVYGPTECTVDTTVKRIERDSSEPLIGAPLSNVQTYVLDENDRPVPLGVHAELLIGGVGVARGYLTEPDLTAEKFVPDAFSGKPGARLYRSGDRVRQRTGGELAFLGRLDHQVKIRGHRIELGEVEAALRKDPQVRETVVVEREEQRGEKRLIAYIVADRQAGLSLLALQKNLREQLPDYMIPTGWVVLDEMPLTPSGKVDRASLPEPGRTRLDTGQSFVAPPTMIEEALAAVWREVLNLDHVRNDDNFFWLGGHSLLATKIISRIRESFQVELPVRTLFESPTLAGLATAIETAMRAGTSVAAPPVKALPPIERLPLSYAQQRLWLVNQLMPGSNAYNLPAEMWLDTTVNAGALEQSISEMVRRHEALRTTFPLVGNQPVQRIEPAHSLRLPLVDLRALPPDEQTAMAERLRHEAALRSFDLERGPLVRTMLVRSTEQSLFLLNMHHIVSDGWSMGVVLHELETVYSSFLQGSPSPLPELEVQYSDYARWQRDWLLGEVLQKEVAFWKGQLEGAPTLLELETDRPRQLMRLPRGAQQPVAFSPEVSQWLREFHREEGATLFMTLMAGFHALLWRYTGQSDILVGTPIASRSRVELESMIGFFVNMIPIRTSFRGHPTFRELVTQVRNASLAAYTHQDLPFDKLVEELQPRRAAGRNPIFQVILAFQNATAQMSMGQVSVPSGAPVSADVKFDLEVHLSDSPAGVAGSFVYSPDLFDPAFISRMVYHFQRLFEKAMADPDSDIATLSLLDEAEYQQVVEDWNDTAAAVPAGCIHDVLAREVETRPDAIALEFGDAQITYRALDEQSNRLAHRLRREGVGTETFVGVMVERSANLIVALVGIMKAGGVYVPLNLTDPPKRIQFILEDAVVKTVVTSKAVAKNLGERDLSLVYIDELADEASDDLQNNSSPDNLAYVMYTSGSTGTPKGVGITHTNVVGFVKTANFGELNAAETMMHVSPISFDASTFEIWGALLNGSRLVVYPPSVPSLSELGDIINRTQITTLFLTTGLFHQFIDSHVTNIGAVRQLLTGGDALSPTLLNKGLEQIENVQIVNCYGPTESTVMACCYRVERDRLTTSVPIGRPVSNTRLYIVNSMQPAGIGERGELFIGGYSLGRGYHNRPDLTAERFIPDAFGPQPGSRLYRTGDAARYSNDGLIQFLGRIDDQVKISGYRIEPREIETVLSTHPALTAAAVIVREDTPGQKFLVAYVAPNSENPPTNDDLRAYLKERLPEYMVPSVYVTIESLPLTQHGKVDRNALPAPQLSLTRSGREYVAPENDLQQQLVDLWEELFKLHPIGITDNFFELGGHSLQMIMLVARVEERLGKRVAMAELFNDPTIRHLAELVGHGKESIHKSLLVPMRTEGTKPAIFTPHSSGGNVWCYKELAQALGDDQPIYGIQPSQLEDGVMYQPDIKEMAIDYVQAVRAFQPTGPYSLVGWSMGAVIAFEMARQLQDQGEEIAMLALIDAAAPEGEDAEYSWGFLLSIFAFDLGLTEEHVKSLFGKTLPQMAQLRQLWVEARKVGVVPTEMTLIEFRKLFDTFKIHANTMRRYRPEEFRGRVMLFRAEEDVEEAMLRNDPKYFDWRAKTAKITSPYKGWGRVATEGVEQFTIPGNHFSMLREPNVQIITEHLREWIEAARARSATA